ncbi:D-aminoacyl-tRNA deacylase [Corynebacterium aurimucosum]|uniref:Putative D-tyrosyl-tRNA(Tyr) deacylase n=1 Tax=Corynebacterium aurimucosum (strain ATCC 700975 / DSM 44827 / CIP 107346 / CN-1) TaxID=548476 RepID=C3PGU9_CORA7|nr:D-aminoacyl-tRNA deacylase [Corynebacterium aurimucosum]ACP33053.1 putative D-tyrosyl-tRNA(Tyr) deacylase [Corynebacterium aurimucosum ATCC 700975]QQU92812.1 D-tyrosyl-tRNA(Tyr) deacylase [Corynebacterium aurimucosum]
MRAVLTRVSEASVTVDNDVVGSITCPDTGGILALIGVSREDIEAGGDFTASDGPTLEERMDTMARKIAELRILEGETSVVDSGAPVLVVSQFTLYGRTAKGRRPSWPDAAPGEAAEPVIQGVVARLRERGITVEEGRFGAMMRVSSVNEGPFTVLVEV